MMNRLATVTMVVILLNLEQQQIVRDPIILELPQEGQYVIIVNVTAM